MSTYENAADIEFFNDCLDTLIKDLLYDDLGVTEYRWDQNLESSIQKSAWVASLLASSNNEEHQSKALSFAILAYIKKRGNDEEEMYERYLYIVLSRIERVIESLPREAAGFGNCVQQHQNRSNFQ